MAGLVKEYGGMRVLRQDPWECLISFICTQGTSVGSTSRAVDKLACSYGDSLSLDGVKYKSFPPPQHLLDAGETNLERLKLARFRSASTIYAVARDVTKGKLDLNALAGMPYEQARNCLMSDRYRGIGWKIADCVCLFSLDMPKAVPVDRHVAAGLLEHYGKKWIREKNTEVLSLWAQQYSDGDTRRSRRIDPSRHRAAGAWVREYFGVHAGYASQLLFHDQFEKTKTR